MALRQALIKENILSSFLVTNIFPFNYLKIDDKMAPIATYMEANDNGRHVRRQGCNTKWRRDLRHHQGSLARCKQGHQRLEAFYIEVVDSYQEAGND
jgi:hypothetical protein